jgi:hypothetical protein
MLFFGSTLCILCDTHMLLTTVVMTHAGLQLGDYMIQQIKKILKLQKVQRICHVILMIESKSLGSLLDNKARVGTILKAFQSCYS